MREREELAHIPTPMAMAFDGSSASLVMVADQVV